MRLHESEPMLTAGAPLADARAAVVSLHGRGAGAADILALAASELGAAGVALLAPEARHASWYPRSFLAPIDANEPWLGSALARVGGLVAEIEGAGVPAERIVLFGFSQGACLACEFAARHPRRYGAVVTATGGRIGPPGTLFVSAGDLAGTPAHFAAGDPDPHVPWHRVEESAANFRAMGAEVTTHREPGFPHAVHPATIAFARRALAALV